MIVLTDKLGFRSRPFRMFWSDFMYTIGQVSQMCGIPVSTLRYYDKEGLFRIWREFRVSADFPTESLKHSA